MFVEIEKFFATLLGEDIYSDYKNVIFALLLGFALMLIYGLLVRPLLNLCVGKNKSFFDVIMTVLIITVSLSIAVSNFIPMPDAPEDAFTQEDIDESYLNGRYDTLRELVQYEFEDYSEFQTFLEDNYYEYIPDHTPIESSFCTHVLSFERKVEFEDANGSILYLFGDPFCLVGDELVYIIKFENMCYDIRIFYADVYNPGI